MDPGRLPELLGPSVQGIEPLERAGLTTLPPPTQEPKGWIDYVALRQTYPRTLAEIPFSDQTVLAQHIGVSRVWGAGNPTHALVQPLGSGHSGSELDHSLRELKCRLHLVIATMSAARPRIAVCSFGSEAKARLTERLLPSRSERIATLLVQFLSRIRLRSARNFGSERKGSHIGSTSRCVRYTLRSSRQAFSSQANASPGSPNPVCTSAKAVGWTYRWRETPWSCLMTSRARTTCPDSP